MPRAPQKRRRGASRRPWSRASRSSVTREALLARTLTDFFVFVYDRFLVPHGIAPPYQGFPVLEEPQPAEFRVVEPKRLPAPGVEA